jgi:hypothetical protein
MTRLLPLLCCALAIGLSPTSNAGQELTAEEARAIARQAYVYGFPMVEAYEAMHRQALAPGRFFRAPLNQLSHDAKPADATVTKVVWPNADTVLSTVWLDLRAEPVVLTLPTVEKERYHSVQLVDLHTFNFAYLGTRATGNEGGDFLIAGPLWQGEKPPGVRAIIRSETQFAGAMIRIQHHGPADQDRIREIQGAMQVRPLGAYLGQPVAAAEPPPPWPAPRKDMTDGLRLFPYLNFLFQYGTPHPSEAELMARFARLGIGPGLKFDPSTWSPAVRQAAVDGIAEVWSKDFPEVLKRIDRGELTADECFGSRESLKGDFVKRAIGARIGLFGNSPDEVVYVPYFSDRDGRLFDASASNYTLRFEKDQLPPSDAFWSITAYDADTHLLVANPLQRHAIRSSMLESMTRGEDGSLTLYIQKSSPGKTRESNWLPAPNGPFHLMLRIYQPKANVLAKTWKAPELERTKR